MTAIHKRRNTYIIVGAPCILFDFDFSANVIADYGERRSRNTRSRHTNRICLPSAASDDETQLCGILRNRY